MQHDPFADDDTRLEQVRTRLADRLRDGLLPDTKPLRIFAGHGSGWPCAVCDRDIPPAEVELELEFGSPDASASDAQVFLVHHSCYELWDATRRAMLQRNADPPRSTHPAAQDDARSP